MSIGDLCFKFISIIDSECLAAFTFPRQLSFHFRKIHSLYMYGFQFSGSRSVHCLVVKGFQLEKRERVVLSSEHIFVLLRIYSCSFRVDLVKLHSQFSQRTERSSSLHSQWISSVSCTLMFDDMLVPPAWGETEGAEPSSVFSLLNGQSITDIAILSILSCKLRLYPTVYFESVNHKSNI